MSGRWLTRAARRPGARLKLFCFPHAGAGPSAYRLWPAGLPEDIELIAVGLPGRESRLREPSLNSVPAMVEALLPAVVSHLDTPFSFFGHSMGAVVAFETTRALAHRGYPVPRHLFVSARRPPRLPDPDPPVRGLPDAALVSEIVRRYGGIPQEALEHGELLALLLPSLRADLTAIETHEWTPGPPVACPVTAFGGLDDPRAPRADLEAWQEETSGGFRLRQFPGGHFYLTEHRADLLADVAAALGRLGRP